MCGRATLTTPPIELAEIFHLDEPPEITPRFNVAPGQPIAILRAIPGEPAARRIELAAWGIVPPDEPLGNDERRTPFILARVESIFTRGAFRQSAARRRCLVIVDGFYEWAGAGKDRRPFHFRKRDGRPFALAGLWAPGAGRLECVLLTTAAQPPVRAIHDRMPIVLAAGSYAPWLDPGITAETAVRPLAVVAPDADLVAAEVSTFVNNARNEGAACLAPAEQRSLF